jgi:hypothetical protein
MEKSFEGELGKEKTWMAVLHTTMILSLLNLSKEGHRYIDKQQQIGRSTVSLPARIADENRPLRYSIIRQ